METMKTRDKWLKAYLAAPDAINHNNRRYYIEGVSARPNGTVFGWDDWKEDIESCFSPVRHGIWDRETERRLNLDDAANSIKRQ
jgi:hypothetical protein